MSAPIGRSGQREVKMKVSEESYWREYGRAELFSNAYKEQYNENKTLREIIRIQKIIMRWARK
jgi:hypothetical protein